MVRNLFAVTLGLLAAATVYATPLHQCPDNFALVNDRCVHIYTDNFNGVAPPMQWPRARELCIAMGSEKWQTDLAKIDEAYLSSISSLIINDYPGMMRYIFWVGASKANGVWQWTDKSPVDIMSYIWFMSSPSADRNGVYGILVPSGAHNRFYMLEYSEEYVGPSFVCEAKQA